MGTKICGCWLRQTDRKPVFSCRQNTFPLFRDLLLARHKSIYVDVTNFKHSCQIILGTTYQNGKIYQNDLQIYQTISKYTKWPQHIPNNHKIYIFYCKTLQIYPNIPKIYVHAIWQHWFQINAKRVLKPDTARNWAPYKKAVKEWILGLLRGPGPNSTTPETSFLKRRWCLLVKLAPMYAWSWRLHAKMIRALPLRRRKLAPTCKVCRPREFYKTWLWYLGTWPEGRTFLLF
jgi:hypothetical protein